MDEKTEKTEEKVSKPWQFQKGDDPRRNLDGRPPGALNFSTKWKIFIDKVAKQNNMTPEEIDEQLFAVGFKKAKDGEYAFYRDIHDRVYGKPLQQTELKVDGEIPVRIIEVSKIDAPTDNQN